MAERPKPVSQMTAAKFEAAIPDEEARDTYLLAHKWPTIRVGFWDGDRRI
jgi:hypothetical protein